jgi:hypothetical protein
MSDKQQSLLLERIKRSSKLNIKESTGMRESDYLIWGTIPVFVSEPHFVSIEHHFPIIKQVIEENIPKQLFDVAQIRQIVIRSISGVVDDRHYDALIENDIIYLKPTTSSPKLFAANIIHEIGHSILNKNRSELITDQLKQEYLEKRQKFINLVRINWSKISTEPFPAEQLRRIKGSFIRQPFWDHFFSKMIGKEKAVLLSQRFLPDPYCLTSIDEYFCVAFQYFWIEKSTILQDMCPAAQKVIGSFSMKIYKLRSYITGGVEDQEMDRDSIEYFRQKKQEEEDYPHWRGNSDT